MKTLYIGFWLTNLIIPGDPETVELTSPTGSWTFYRNSRFGEFKKAVCENGQCAQTYSVEATTTFNESRSDALEDLLGELIPVCLGASYLTGLSVAPSRSLPHSEISFCQVGSHFPRQRAMGSGFPVTKSHTEFMKLLEHFLVGYGRVGATEKALLLCHHWLDALAFWSLEDLVLSTGTVLEVIAATAEAVAPSGTDVGTFNKNLAYAAQRFGLATLPPDFRKMRNDLVHEGVLSGSKFPAKSPQECGLAAAEALDWIDTYIFAALALGQVPAPRFAADGFRGANSFSVT